MYCIECGSENLATAKFCRKCGARVAQSAGDRHDASAGIHSAASFDIEEETLVASRPESGIAKTETREPGQSAESENELFAIGPTLMFVKAGYVATAIAAVLLVALISAFLGDLISVTVAIVIGFLLFLIPAFYHLKKKMVRYRLTDSQLEIDEGFVARSTRNVPIRRIQDVTVSATATQRLFGYGDLMIDNASDEGGKVVLKDINDPRHYADALLRQMKRIER